MEPLAPAAALPSPLGMACPEGASPEPSQAQERAASSAELAALILDKVEVAVVPGEAFGTPGYLRLSYATSEDKITEGIARIATLLSE